MKGYVSFLLAASSLFLILSLIQLLFVSKSIDNSPALLMSSTYSIHMNLKESIIESIRQGAVEGFSEYDASHDVTLCIHCPDHFCSIEPLSPNVCDPLRCSKCFREEESLVSSELKSIEYLNRLKTANLGFDFSFTNPDFRAYGKTDLTSKNHFSLSYLTINQPVPINLIYFENESSSIIPKGLVIEK